MRSPIGVAGVVAALSVTSDLTRGHPRGEAMRAFPLATDVVYHRCTTMCTADVDENRDTDPVKGWRQGTA